MMKKLLLSGIMAALSMGLFAQVDGDYRTGTTNVTWSNATDWQVRSGGTWSTAGTPPGSSNNVWIQSGHNVTLTADASCNTLNHAVNTTGLASLNLQTYKLNVSGNLRAYRQGSGAGGSGTNQGFNASTGSADGNMPGVDQNAASRADWIKSTTGRIVIVGMSRTLSTWGSSNATTANPNGYNLEFNPGSVITITLTESLRAKNIYFTSGTVSTSQEFFCSQTTANTGDVEIGFAATVIFTKTGTGNIFSRGSGSFGNFTLNGTLEVTGVNAGSINSQNRSIANSSTIIVSSNNASVIQRWPDFGVANVSVGNMIFRNAAEKRRPAGMQTLTINGEFRAETGCGPVYTRAVAITIAASGKMVFQDGTHFLNDNSGSISGAGDMHFTRKGHAAAGMYNYWSSPMATTVTTATLGGLAADIYRLPFNSLFTSNFQNFSGNLETGRGYTATTNGSGVRTFVGKPNMGNVNTGFILASGTGYSLLGNPFPASIDANAFRSTNSGRMGVTFYYWAQTVPYHVAGSFSSADYASWNTNTNTGVAATGLASASGAVTPNRYIDACQGFIVEHRAGAAGTAVVFNLAHANGSASAKFYKDDMPRFWVNVENGGWVAQTALVMTPDASNNYDEEYDSKVFPGNGFKVFSQVDDKDIVINALNAIDVMNDGVTVPLTIQELPKNGEVKFSLANMENSEGYDVFLYDAEANKIADLRQKDYTVNVNGNQTVKGRFHLGFKRLDMSKASEKLMVKSYLDSEGNLVVDHTANPNLKISEINVYNVSGQLVANLDANGQGMISRYPANFATGIYIINVNTSEGVANSKVFLK